MDYNNIKALIRPIGNQFWNWQNSAYYLYPADSSTSTIFTSTLWVGGKDADENLYVCGEMYRQQGFDYRTGPLSFEDELSLSLNTSMEYDTIWEITRQEINEFLLLYNTPSYNIPQSILDWPAHGNVDEGQSFYLAPFIDANGNGYYDPINGDYPNIRGHKCLFFIFNDFGEHTESGGTNLGIEVHGMAYAYVFPDQPAYDNTIFINYKIINRSSRTYLDTYVGLFTDFDIGYPKDDYIGCDVPRGTFYAYNADDFDETAEGVNGYGSSPPAQSATLLSGPYMDSDGIDNPSEDLFGEQMVDESINGMFFGDGIVDNERLGMTSFTFFNNSGTGANANTLDPHGFEEYYNYMTGLWRDETPFCFGGTGHYSGGGDTDIPTKFVFPGNPNTDIWGWGTNGVVQDAWSEVTEGNPPADRRGMCSSGPFTFSPGDTAYVDVAFVTGEEFNTKSSSIQTMNQFIDVIRADFESNLLPDGSPFIVLSSPHNNIKQSNHTNIYPNPANDVLRFDFSKDTDYQIQIMDINGKLVFSRNISASNCVFDISSFDEGVYFVKISDGESIETKKLVVLDK